MYVGLKEVPDSPARWWGKLELNPSRVVDPDGYSLATIDQLGPILATAWSASAELLAPACSLDEAKVRRLDVARDFTGVFDIPSLLAGLQNVPRPWAGRTGVFRGGSTNGPETLDVGGNSGHVKLYNKYAETRGGVPEGTLRWECEARKGWLGRYGEIATMADINRRSIELLAANRWEWSGMGHEVMGNPEAVARIWSTEWVPLGPGGDYVRFTEAQRCSFLGWLLAACYGRDGTSSKATKAKYRRLARELGIAIAPTTFGEGAGFSARLDFESGRQVLRAQPVA
jgi:hypothetical protein